MFGNQNGQSDAQQDNQIPDQSIDSALSIEPTQPDTPSSPSTDAASDQSWQHPGTPLGDGQLPAPVGDAPDPAAPATPLATDDLIDIKQQALSQLSPLVGHLDQTP